MGLRDHGDQRFDQALGVEFSAEGATELGVGRQIDIFTGPLDDTLPHITFFPSGG